MNLPKEFITYIQKEFKEEANNLISSLDTESPVSIRLNKNKDLDRDISALHKVPWCDTGYYLESRPQFTFDPLFHAGSYYVQEASSMFIEHILKQYLVANSRVLDLCAAPGGKSTLIASLIGEDSLLISNEVIRSRANILAENIMKWGTSNVVVTNNTPKDIGNSLTSYFDIILVDAPCSGEGMFRKDPQAINEWSLDNVKLCKKRQQQILSDIWSSLKPNGILIYSTCTYNIEENEENIAWIRDELGGEILPVSLSQEEWNITTSLMDDVYAYRFLPHKATGEGFFCAVVRKSADLDFQLNNKNNKTKKDNKQNAKFDTTIDLKTYVKDSDKFTFSSIDDLCTAYPSIFDTDIELISSCLHVLSMGIVLGEYKGKDFIPNQSLALSNHLNRNPFAVYDVDWKKAIQYLKREAIELPHDTPRGYVLITYRNKPLGFVKNVGNRSNNLYPQMWKIRSNNLPDSEVNIF